MSNLIECKKKLKSGGYAEGTVFADQKQISANMGVLIPLDQVGVSDDETPFEKESVVDSFSGDDDSDEENIDTDVAPEVKTDVPTLTHDEMVAAIEAKTGTALHHKTKASEESTLKKYIEVCSV